MSFSLRLLRMNTPMANDHPFQVLFETLGRLPVAHAEAVNRRAYEILYDILSVPLEKSGRCILLRAPRAGHGKTHLLSRIQHHLGANHEFIPLHAAFGCQIDAATVAVYIQGVLAGEKPGPAPLDRQVDLLLAGLARLGSGAPQVKRA